LHTFWAVDLLLSESCAIINDLDVILSGFILQIIYTIVFPVKRLNNLTLHVRLFNRLTRKIVVYISLITIINSITKSYILNIKIRPLVTEYALMIKLVDGTNSAHSFNPYAYFGHSWSSFDIQNLRLVILYFFHLEIL
jgi:hypothetical protein